MQLYFIRHGESEANLLNEISNRGLKHPLTERGRQQMEILAEKLQNLNLLAFYTSPILRARQSAQILSEKLNFPHEITEALREYDLGILEGRSDPATWEQYDWLWQQWLREGKPEVRIEDGESFNDIKARFVPFVENLVKQFVNGTGTVLLLGHGGTYRCMLPLLLDNIDNKFAIAHSLGHIEYVIAEPRGERLVCLQWNDIVLDF